MNELPLLRPDWPAPPQIRAAVSTREGGVSLGSYAALNLGDHVGDSAAHVAENRRRFAAALGWSRAPRWLSQVHGVAVAAANDSGPATADASYTRTPGCPCVVLTADCLPVLFCTGDGQQVAAAHAGWRGLAAGVLEATLQQLDPAPGDVMAWLGPAIGPRAFQVGAEVRQAFLAVNTADAAAFTPDGERYRADLFALARARLTRAGVRQIYGGGVCTVEDSGRWFSHRRDGTSGRFASAIWIEAG